MRLLLFAAFTLVVFSLAVAAGRALGAARPTDIFACEAGVSPARSIALLDVGARILLPVTRTSADDYAPAWNAAGTRLTFREVVTQRLDKIWALELGTFTMSAQAGTGDREDAILRARFEAGSGAHAFTLGYGQMWQGSDSPDLAPLGYGFRPSLSPDGQWALYYADTPDDLNAEIYAYNPTTRTTVNLSQHAAHDWNPVWSPDGSQIAFVSTRDGNAEIYVVPFACADGGRCGRQARRFTQSGGSDVDPTWAADGRRLAFVHEQRRVSQLWMVDTLTGETAPLWPSGDDCRAPAWRP